MSDRISDDSRDDSHALDFTCVNHLLAFLWSLFSDRIQIENLLQQKIIRVVNDKTFGGVTNRQHAKSRLVLIRSRRAKHLHPFRCSFFCKRDDDLFFA